MPFTPPQRPTNFGPAQGVFDSVVTLLKQLIGIPLLNGRLIRDVSFDGGSNIVVKHGLGRLPLGWVTVRRTYGSGDVESEVSRNKTDLVLYSDSAFTVDIWVF